MEKGNSAYRQEWRGLLNTIHHLFKRSRSDKQHLFVLGRRGMARNSMAWNGMEWHRMRHEEEEGEEECGCWKGISGWALTLGSLCWKRRGPLACSASCTHTGPKGVWGFPRPSPLAYSHSTLPSERQGRFSDVHVDWALWKPFDVLLLFWGDRRKAGGLLDVVPRTTIEEAAVCKRRWIGPGIKDGWRRKENSVSKEGSHVIGVSQCL